MEVKDVINFLWTAFLLPIGWLFHIVNTNKKENKESLERAIDQRREDLKEIRDKVDEIDKSFGASLTSVYKRISNFEKTTSDTCNELSEHVSNVGSNSVDQESVRQLIKEFNEPLSKLLQSLDDKIDHLNEQMARAEEREKIRNERK